MESEIPTLQPKYALDNNTLMISICPTSPHVLSILLAFTENSRTFRLGVSGGSQQNKASVNQLHGQAQLRSTDQLVKTASLAEGDVLGRA